MTDTNHIEAEVSAVIKRLTGCPDIIGYGGESLAGEISRALSARASASEGGWAEYETRMGEAGDRYICSVALNGSHTLPAQFRWHELWDVLNRAAAPQPAQTQGEEWVMVSRNMLRAWSALLHVVPDGVRLQIGDLLAAAPQPQANLIGYEDGSSHGRTTPPAHGDGEGERSRAEWLIDTCPRVHPDAMSHDDAGTLWVWAQDVLGLLKRITTHPSPVGDCPHKTRCDCLGACKYGFAGNGAMQNASGGRG